MRMLPRAAIRQGMVQALIASLVGSALLAGSFVAPVSAAPPGVHTLAGDRGHDISRTVGTGVHVNARAAAVRAEAHPRTTTRAKHAPRVNLGATRAAPGTTRPTKALKATSTLRTALAPAPRDVAQPDPVVVNSFAATSAAEACGCEPPDPWIAVSPLHVVTTTNGMVRVTTRAGALLMQEPTWALFAVPADRGDTDPRILWDSFHARWVGIISTFNSDSSANGLRLAISESSDPTAGWIVYPIEYGAFFPDYPGISTSSSRIVITSDDFENNATDFAGPTWLMADWANILAGTDLFLGGATYGAAIAHFRPAIMLSSASYTPIIYENGASPAYFEVGGSAHSWIIPAATDRFLTTLGIADFTLAPDPVQPGPNPIDDAFDERPTDAVFRNGSLWFVATADYNDGTDDWPAARWTRVLTTASGIGPTAASDFFAAETGTQYFMPGIGINAGNTAFFLATKVDDTSTNPTTVLGAWISGSGVTGLQDVATSTTAYVGKRWGDFMGVAADPAATGAVWVQQELVAADGTWRTSVARIASDGAPPSVPGAIVYNLAPPATLGATVPVRVSWAASVDPESGVARYRVERSDDGGGFFGVSTVATSITQPLLVGHLYQYRVSAVDAVGNVGPVRVGGSFRPTSYLNTTQTTFTGSWGTALSSLFSGGSTRWSSTAGATATFTGTNARSIGIVATRATTRGSFRVYVDGVLKATVSSSGTPTIYRRLLYQYSWAVPATHKIKIVILGTAGHPRVDLDAFVVLR